MFVIAYLHNKRASTTWKFTEIMNLEVSIETNKKTKEVDTPKKHSNKMSAILVVTHWWLKTSKLQIYRGPCNKMLILAVSSTTPLTNQIQETNIYILGFIMNIAL